MSSPYAIRIWVDDNAYANGWDMSLHSSLHKAMMRVLQYLLVDFNVQQYYNEDEDLDEVNSTANCSVSNVIDTVRDEFDKCQIRFNFMFRVKNPSAPFKTLVFDVRKVQIN